MKLNFRDIIEFLFIPILSFGVYVLSQLNNNVNDLNIRVGVLIAMDASKEKRIDKNERDIKEVRVEIKELRDMIIKLKKGD